MLDLFVDKYKHHVMYVCRFVSMMYTLANTLKQKGEYDSHIIPYFNKETTLLLRKIRRDSIDDEKRSLANAPAKHARVYLKLFKAEQPTREADFGVHRISCYTWLQYLAPPKNFTKENEYAFLMCTVIKRQLSSKKQSYELSHYVLGLRKIYYLIYPRPLPRPRLFIDGNNCDISGLLLLPTLPFLELLTTLMSIPDLVNSEF
mmetsp:Transcript_373/g.568  ORF Transcript_373/g.568 Transcript_373/m.568 type:complete len:203 (-) Transcript_373:23-631(-)